MHLTSLDLNTGLWLLWRGHHVTWITNENRIFSPLNWIMMLNKHDFNQNLMNCLNNLFGSVRSSRNANVRLSVCLSGEKCSRAHNLHLRSVSDQSQVSLSLRSVWGPSQVSLRFLRSVSGVSVLTSSDRRSLKYSVLLRQRCFLLPKKYYLNTNH